MPDRRNVMHLKPVVSAPEASRDEGIDADRQAGPGRARPEG